MLFGIFFLMNKAALSQLGNFNGTESYHRLSPFKMVLTDGAKFLADNAECYWLFNEIAAAQTLSQIKKDSSLQDMQVWTLKPFQGGARLICERDSDDVAWHKWHKDIPWTDFPFDAMGEVKIWVAPTSLDGNTLVSVAYLPNEH